MHPKLTKAIEKARHLLAERLAESVNLTKEKARLEGLSRDDLVAELLAIKAKKEKVCSVEEAAYIILGETECAELSYAMVAVIIREAKGSNTTAGNISYYVSRAIEKGYDCVPRIHKDELRKLLVSTK